ncbi:MAG: hypothetical protein LC802_02500 [Acidobacteria bacterium]|nr:hypothetical protein [Acidobacteriota bacterium]
MIREKLLSQGIGEESASAGAAIAGWAYAPIFPVLMIHGVLRGKRRKRMETQNQSVRTVSSEQ